MATLLKIAQKTDDFMEVSRNATDKILQSKLKTVETSKQLNDVVKKDIMPALKTITEKGLDVGKSLSDSKKTVKNDFATKKATKNLQSAELELESVANQIDIQIATLEKQAKLQGWTKAALAIAIAVQVNRLATATKSVTSSIAGQSTTLGRIEQDTQDNETLFQWVAMSSNICPDCQGLHGEVKTYKQWMLYGLPGSGHTICKGYCQCELMEVTSEKTTPQKLVRGYTDSKGNQVKSAKGPQGGKAKIMMLEPIDV